MKTTGPGLRAPGRGPRQIGVRRAPRAAAIELPPAWTLVVALAVFALGSKLAGGGHGVPDLAIDGLTGGSYLACGVALGARRTSPGLARLLVLASAAWFAEDLVTSRVPVVFASGAVLQNAFDPLFVALVLAYPTGTLRGPPGRAIVGCAIANSIGLAGLIVLVDPPIAHGTRLAGLSFLHVAGAADTIRQVQDLIGVVLSIVVLGVIVRRQRRLPAGSVRRVVFTRTAVVCALVFAGLAVHDAVDVGRDLSAGVTDSFGVLQSLAVLAFPIWIAIGIAQVDAARIRLGELARARLSPAALEAELRAALDDPQLRVLTDPPAVLPPPLSATVLRSGERDVGVLIHGRALGEETELLRLAASAAADALGRRETFDPSARSAVERLTGRQREVLALLADGHPNEVIARRLGISVRTVDKHVSNVYDVLDLPAELRLNRRVGATIAWIHAELDA
jgi:DNA-binding CsgD family transcriptional regulator